MNNDGEDVDDKQAENELLVVNDSNPLYEDEPSTYPKRERIASSSNVDIQQKPSQQGTISFKDSIKDRRIPSRSANKYNLMYGRYNLFLIIFMWIIFIVIWCFDSIDPNYCNEEYKPDYWDFAWYDFESGE